MLTHWLPTNSPSKLPESPHNTVGVGGVVINQKKQILVVTEKTGPATKIWKIPGGRLDNSEDICDAAVREVEEETGIKTKFKQILCFRHHHDGPFQSSDLYFVCLLEPLTWEIKIQEDEISDCTWMAIDEFISLPYYKGVYKKILEIVKEAANRKYTGWDAESLPVVFLPGNNYIYHGNQSKL